MVTLSNLIVFIALVVFGVIVIALSYRGAKNRKK